MPFSMSFSTFNKKNTSSDLRVDIPPQMANGMQAYNGTSNGGPGSPTPFIKNEPRDDAINFQQFSQHPEAYSMSANSHFQTQHGGFTDQDFGGADSIDPSELTVQNGGFSFGTYSSNQGLGFMNGGGGGLSIGDDDLRAGLRDDLFDGLDAPRRGNDMYSYSDMNGDRKVGNGAEYSHTPDNPPAGSPYMRGFPQHDQFRRLYNDPAESPSSYNSPVIGSDSTQGTNFDGFMNPQKRKNGPIGMDRSERSPSVMSPRTPNTPALHGLSLTGAESISLPAQPIQNAHLRQHHKTLSNPWDGTPGSSSYVDSPLSSPGMHVHPQISDVFKSKGASLPAKVDHMTGNSQEAKKRRRRESHNLVERRRRDNINERIQDLSQLVPHHRLEDEKVRKQLLNSGSLSPTTVGASGSPPRATSGLAVGPGGVGRRAIPPSGISGEEKDKGPNKGDILNGAVGWTRDLMWAMQMKLEQEREVRELVARLGGTYPFEESEADRRMASELETAIAKAKRDHHDFGYSRAPGSGLRVPGYTDYAGQPLGDGGSDRVSPGSTGKPMQNGGSSRGTPHWNDGMMLKEEDESYSGMDMS
ncbi:hypothetical protein BZA05DRAFT_416349 [Tricharina praecox]|uniref:uncharacterized protein n=1 Tax=Tricharina praecox TaxID=43433 RepID=UPI0022211C29|nr:uncharacterized protein BZA05DRAFT_416349 [Tricharina praecox]KAI5855692.1 hypothetical protein BZA05DRAFT_416349 [Tricharina praecox]